MDSALIQDASACSRRDRPVGTLLRWIREAGPDPVLIALDAPLGWPVALGQALASHRAGEPVHVQANELFRRETDREIRRRFGKTPLDVGADRIARTAHAALELLGELRTATGLPIPLAWSAQERAQVAAIEVYPAVTLLTHGFDTRRYDKRSRGTPLKTFVGNHADIDAGLELPEHMDVLDACVCALAGVEFLAGVCLGPSEEQRTRALREGWIWARERPLATRGMPR